MVLKTNTSLCSTILYLSIGATIGIHTVRSASASRIDVRAGEAASRDNSIATMVLAHGILMSIQLSLHEIQLFGLEY